MTEDELDAALARHPRIGEKAGAGHDAAFSSREQAGVEASDAERLVEANRAYEARFDRVFLIRAAGRSSGEILAECERRLANDDDAERAETIEQLTQIALLRLEQVI
jgi:2-oxo-4-hydroxy-4-carboxy-5-ureidoimidazoline decarboxylase